jgi:hypothetical protein
MATYNEIQKYSESTQGFLPHTCWNCRVKELCNSPHQKEAPNRIAKKETTVVPKAKIDCIKDALKH